MEARLLLNKAQMTTIQDAQHDARKCKNLVY